ncbi:hypothetical protein [Desmospora profundinema]|uniref:Uncharacterized protein n=1 Tax=Desmospora profundinema TaxID=1571184 RepID=A0ABU1IK08_9BACL|nr:hypothetical protein [Desmospora profundinema]MDR6224718.1 hypothetical protein [Desmospora profundinema]
MSMRKMDIQIDIAREYEKIDKEAFNRDLRKLLEKYFELNSIHIRKEVHTVEVQKVNLKQGEEATEEPVLPETLDIERQPLVTVFDSSNSTPELPKRKPAAKKNEDDPYY